MSTGSHECEKRVGKEMQEHTSEYSIEHRIEKIQEHTSGRVQTVVESQPRFRFRK